MSTINLNVSPFFDDFDESKDYLRVLFRPGFAVQARELTQLQTIQQKQTSRLGNHIFKDGSRVTEGNVNVNFNVHTMNLISGSGNVNFPLSGALTGSIEGTLDNFSETIISNQDNSIQARVLRTPTGSIGTNKTGNIYFTYITSKQFSDSDEGYIYARNEDNPEQTVTYANVYTDTGPATMATILPGVYYIDGFFSRIEEQNVVVSSTTNKPTAAIGFSITSKAISANDDASLFDNARGSTNEGAPGANRLQNSISVLIKSTLDQGSDPTFYKQVEIEDGVILGDTEPTPQGLRTTPNPMYNGLGDTIARRRKEESGSYAVKKFVPKINDNNYDDSDRFSVSFSKGLAYINGYRQETFADTQIFINRNTEAKKETNHKVPMKGAPYVDVFNVNSGTLSGMLTADANGIGAYANKVALRDSDNHTIGFARAYAFQATNGETEGRLYLHDIKMFQHVTFGSGGTYDSDSSRYWKDNLIAGEHVRVNLNGKVQHGDVIKLDESGRNDSDWTNINNIPAGSARIAGTNGFITTGVLLTNSNSQFQTGARIEGDISRSFGSNSPRVANAKQFKFSDVHKIKGSTNDSEGVSFEAQTQWTPGTGATLKNVSGKLFGKSGKTFKTLRSGTVPFDNDFDVLYKAPPTISSTDGSLAVTPDFANSQWSTHFRNGDYKKTRVDDAVEITKQLKFAVLKVRNTSDITRTSSVNSSWSALDRKINLFYPDIYKVYKIVQGTTNNSFGTSTTEANAAFDTIKVNISGGATIPQGSVLVGKSSKTRARVALSNTIATGESTKSGSTGYHILKTGTGASDLLEVCFEKGSAFTAGEELRVDVPERESAITTSITFTEVDSKVAGSDITGNYLLDNGQRVDYYGIGSIVRKTGVPAPSNGDILIFFSYFDANPFESFYYSVDSYSGDGFYKVDPRYYGRPIEIKGYDATTGTNLRDVIDFRFRQRLTNGYSTSNNPLSFRYRELENTGISILPDGQFATDAEFYTAQNISFVLTNKGNIKTVLGVSDVQNPKDPDIQVDGMLLATIKVPPAVRYPAREIALFSDQQRGYTMRDIGKLERRIKNLETSVSLSLLESKALQDNIGSRVKSGFIVDDFSSVSNTPADLSNNNFRASIDVSKNVLRPPSVESNVVLERLNDGTNIDPYFLTSGPGFIMKSYTQEQMLEQTFASSLVRINPYATWVYEGEINLDPSQDFWRDPSWNIVENHFIDRTSFGGGVTSVSETVFDNLTPVTRDIPNSEFNTTETNWTGTVTTTSSTTTDNFLGPWWETTTTTTTTTEVGTTTTSNFIAQEEEFTSSSDFNVREVREKDDAWIRSQVIEFEGTGFRPNTELKAVFDGVNVTNNCAQTDFLPLSTTAARTYGALSVLKTDGKGQIRGRFTVPAQTFKTGTKGFILTDKDGGATTNGTVFFTSRGFFEIGDLTNFRATRDAGNRLVSTSSEDAVGESTTTTTTTGGFPFFFNIGSLNFGDPIAQLFTLPLDPGSDPNSFNPVNTQARVTGSFITSVDVFLGFVDTRANNDHVICEIRSTDNGYPGREILGRARVDVTKANQNLTKPETATNFRFTNPVFLQERTEYAIVLLSPSDTTSAWTALQGEEDVITGGKIDAQPNVGGYFGSFFKSQNASTWTAEQNRDLTFKAYRAKFTTAESSITMRDKSNFYGQPIGQASGGLAIETFDSSYYIKVHHPNHGMYGPDDTHTVRILGVGGNGTIANNADSDLVRFRGESALNGLPISLINNVDGLANLTSSTTGQKHKVKFATQDSYIIDLRERDSDASAINTNPVTGGWHKNVKAGRGGGELVVATSNVQYDSIRTNTQPVNFDETSVSQEVKTTSGANLILRSASNLFGYNTDSIYYKSPLVKESSAVNIPMDKLTDFDSPRLVLGSMNKTASADFEQILKLNTNNEYLSPVIRLDAASQMFVYKNNLGTYIDDSELAGFIDSDLVPSSSAIAQKQYASYKAGLSSFDENAAYITKDITLEVPASQLRVFFDADMDPAAEIVVKYKARAVGDNTEFEELDWQTFPRNQIVNETNFGKFTSDIEFDQYSLTEDVGFEFEAFKIKIEMNSQNSSFISLVRDLRIIAVV